VVTDRSSELSVNENVHFVRTTMMMQLSKGNLVEAGQKGNNRYSFILHSLHVLLSCIQEEQPCLLFVKTILLCY